MNSIALFGGSFDPPHIGHIEIVKRLLSLKEIDKVIIMPTYLNPFKESFTADAKTRLKWLETIFKDYENVEVWDFEVKQKRKVPSVASVDELLKRYEKVYLTIGADNLNSLHKWYKYEELKKKVEFIVATRDDIDINGNYKILHVNIPVSSTSLRKQIDKRYLPKNISDEIYNYYTRKQMEKRVENITKILDKHKAENIEVFDLRDKEYLVDFAIIASSLGAKHTLALLDHLKKELKPDEKFNYVDESQDWVVIDLGDIFIHIMTPEYRTKYDIESFLSELDKNTVQDD
jgi:nicotinate-nucleotide adenylyltransferase